jgi:hypothetical protein
MNWKRRCLLKECVFAKERVEERVLKKRIERTRIGIEMQM